MGVWRDLARPCSVARPSERAQDTDRASFGTRVSGGKERHFPVIDRRYPMSAVTGAGSLKKLSKETLDSLLGPVK